MGGSYSSETKVRPGAYVNVKSRNFSVNLEAEKGIVALPLSLDWGVVKQVIEIDSTSNFVKLLGYDISDSALILIREALKKAKKLLVYRLNTGVQATVTSGSLTLTAKYAGTRGNDITVKILANADSNDFTVETYLGELKVDTQVGSTISDLVANDFVSFSGTGNLVASAGLVLTGGTSGTTSGTDYTTFLEDIEKYSFNILAITTSDVASIESVLKTFIERLRENEGKKIQLVISDYATADYEGVISVKNGVILSDGTTLSAAQCCAYVGGLCASSDVNKSNTYATYDGAINVSTSYTNSQIEQAIKNGEFVFVEKNGKVIIEQDINTLVTFTTEKNEYFHKNRVVRCIDTLQREITQLFEDYYIGKVNNDEEGRMLFKSAVIKLINDNYVQKGAIRDFENGDITIEAGDSIDSVRATIGIKPVDAMEKLYATIILQGDDE